MKNAPLTGFCMEVPYGVLLEAFGRIKDLLRGEPRTRRLRRRMGRQQERYDKKVYRRLGADFTESLCPDSEQKLYGKEKNVKQSNRALKDP
jgi:hypothetical protein